MRKNIVRSIGLAVLGFAFSAAPLPAQDTDDTTGAGPPPVTTAADRDDDDDEFDLGLLGLIGLLGLGGLLRRDHQRHDVVAAPTRP